MGKHRVKTGAILRKGLVMAGIAALLWAGSMMVGNAAGEQDQKAPVITNAALTDCEGNVLEDRIPLDDVSRTVDDRYDHSFRIYLKVTASDVSGENVQEQGTDSGVRWIRYILMNADGSVRYEKQVRAGASGEARIPLPVNWSGSVRLSATDEAGNESEQIQTPGITVETEAHHRSEEHIRISLPEGKTSGKNAERVNYEGPGMPDAVMDGASGNFPVYDKETAADIVLTDKESGIRTCVWTIQQGDRVTTGQIRVDDEGELSGDTDGWQAVCDRNRVTVLSNSSFSLRGEGNDLFLLMEMTDETGHTTYDVRYFGIDTTAPQIQVTYDNNDVKNGKYFRDSRTASILITDQNAVSDSVKVQVKKDGQIVSANVNWKTVAEGIQGTVLFSKDGNYHLEVSAADILGNKSGEPVWQGEAPQIFVIDTGIEEPIVTGITDRAVYDGEISGSFQGTDLHFLQTKVTLTCTTMEVTEKGAVFHRDRDVKENFVSDFKLSPEGFSGNISGIEAIRENDGFYTLTLAMEDLAGNRVEKTWQFTVNRCGSVYVADDDLQKLLTAGYVQNIDKPLVILEYNCTPITAEPGLTLSKDGLPVTDSGISVTDRSGDKTVAEHWYCTRYEIPVSALKNETGELRDGVYALSLESRDGAGHISRFEKSNGYRLRFAVDHTAPVVLSVDGLETEKDTTMQKLTIHLMDNLGLSRLKVLVDGKTVSTEGDYQGLAESAVTCSLPVSDTAQKVTVQVRDLAGNETGKEYETVPLSAVSSDQADNVQQENSVPDVPTEEEEQTQISETHKVKPVRIFLLICSGTAVVLILYDRQKRRKREGQSH